jgi:uncharacterized membrane protein
VQFGVSLTHPPPLQIRKHPNLVSYIMFPLTTNRTEFVAGERVDVLVGLENKNKASAVELKGIQASIRMPQQWDFHIQNVCGYHGDGTRL